jgi:CRP-like cAMP-binding protein
MPKATCSLATLPMNKMPPSSHHMHPDAVLTVVPQGQVGTRTASAQALSYVELYSLSRSTFDRVAAHYPEVLELFRFIAEARQAINENRPIKTDGIGGPKAGLKVGGEVTIPTSDGGAALGA